MQQFGRYLLLSVLWCGVAVYLCYAASLARTAREAAVVTSLEVIVADSSAHGSLVRSDEVRQWLAKRGLKTVGECRDSVRLTAIEQLILRNGFVGSAEAGIGGDGVLRLVVTQRQPLVRLRLDGMDRYVTREGYLFTPPRRSARYVPVVSGSYRPPVPARYEGLVCDHIDHELWKIDTTIHFLERSKLPHHAAERTTNRKLREVRRMRVSRRWWKLESKETFEERILAKREEKAMLRRKYRYDLRCIAAEIDRIDLRQEQLRKEQKKLGKKYEDFVKLLTFVEQLEADDFWGSEVVEIIAQTAPSGALEVQLVPRSGRFTIAFGRIERVEEKLAKLERFYHDGLSVVGWERYRVLDVRFSNQVVCR